MIKKFKQFNEKLSPDLLRRASRSAHDRDQVVRGDMFNKVASDTEREEKNTKKKANYESFMSLTGGFLFGYECKVDPLRVNPGGDTWIEIKGVQKVREEHFRTKKRVATKIVITDNLIKENKLLSIVDDDTTGSGNTYSEHIINLKDLVIDRKDARVYSKFLNWWNGEEKPFSVDDYCIKGIHA